MEKLDNHTRLPWTHPCSGSAKGSADVWSKTNCPVLLMPLGRWDGKRHKETILANLRPCSHSDCFDWTKIISLYVFKSAEIRQWAVFQKVSQQRPLLAAFLQCRRSKPGQSKPSWAWDTGESPGADCMSRKTIDIQTLKVNGGITVIYKCSDKHSKTWKLSPYNRKYLKKTENNVFLIEHKCLLIILLFL